MELLQTSWAIKTGMNEIGSFASNAIIAGIDSSEGKGSWSGLMSNYAQNRYANGSYWTGQAADFAGTMVNTAAMQGVNKSRSNNGFYNDGGQWYSKDSENLANFGFQDSMINQGISRGFGLLGSAIGGGTDAGISGDWDGYGQGMIQNTLNAFNLSRCYSRQIWII